MTYDTPYIQLDTPFKAKRGRVLTVVAVVMDETGVHRSHQYQLQYNVEGAARKDSFGFLVPGIESSGYFVRYGIEIKAKARAQVAGGQEFADFNTYLGIGTYSGVDQEQIKALNLLLIDPDLQGFEGGFPGMPKRSVLVHIQPFIVSPLPFLTVNTTSGKHFGFLVPYHNGQVRMPCIFTVSQLPVGSSVLFSHVFFAHKEILGQSGARGPAGDGGHRRVPQQLPPGELQQPWRPRREHHRKQQRRRLHLRR
jgi:hypothetical protein